MDERLPAVLVMLLLTLSLSGCIDLLGDEGIALEPDYSEGDTWTYRYTSDDIDMNMTKWVESISAEREDEGAIKISESYEISRFEMEGARLKHMNGSSVRYISKDTHQNIYQQHLYQGKMNRTTWTAWYDFQILYNISYNYSGNVPDKVEVGDTWSIEETEVTTTTYFVAGEKTDVTTDTNITTRNYELVEKGAKVEVEAGRFDCYKIEWEEENSDRHGSYWYSKKAKGNVKEVNHLPEATEYYELVSYNL